MTCKHILLLFQIRRSTTYLFTKGQRRDWCIFSGLLNIPDREFKVMEVSFNNNNNNYAPFHDTTKCIKLQ